MLHNKLSDAKCQLNAHLDDIKISEVSELEKLNVMNKNLSVRVTEARNKLDLVRVKTFTS